MGEICMENGLFQSSANGMLNPGVITSSQHLKWVQYLGKKGFWCCISCPRSILRRENIRCGRPQLCMFESVITIGAHERMRYRTSVSNLHLLCIRTASTPGTTFIYCSFIHDTGTHRTSLYISLDSHYRGKFAFACIQKQLPSIYPHFIETCHQLEGHFRGLIRWAALTLNIWGLDCRCVLITISVCSPCIVRT